MTNKARSLSKISLRHLKMDLMEKKMRIAKEIKANRDGQRQDVPRLLPFLRRKKILGENGTVIIAVSSCPPQSDRQGPWLRQECCLQQHLCCAEYSSSSQVCLQRDLRGPLTQSPPAARISFMVSLPGSQPARFNIPAEMQLGTSRAVCPCHWTAVGVRISFGEIEICLLFNFRVYQF